MLLRRALTVHDSQIEKNARMTSAALLTLRERSATRRARRRRTSSARTLREQERDAPRFSRARDERVPYQFEKLRARQGAEAPLSEPRTRQKGPKERSARIL
jgi:hypothetical protein